MMRMSVSCRPMYRMVFLALYVLLTSCASGLTGPGGESPNQYMRAESPVPRVSTVEATGAYRPSHPVQQLATIASASEDGAGKLVIALQRPQQASQVICLEDWRGLHEIVRVPIGCEIGNCCPGCPGPLNLDWEIEFEGSGAKPVLLEFRGLSEAELARLEVEGSAEWVGKGRLRVSPGKSIVQGFQYDTAAGPVAWAVARVELDADADAHSQMSPTQIEAGRTSRGAQQIRFSIRQMVDKIAVRVSDETLLMHACRHRGGGSGASTGPAGDLKASALAVNPDPVHRGFHLLAKLTDQAGGALVGLGRLEWRPAIGWDSRWSHFSDVGDAAGAIGGDFVSLSWYDSTPVLPGNAAPYRGPQIHAYLDYSSPSGRRVGMPTWFTDRGGNQWIYMWSSIDGPPGTNRAAQGFAPKSGSVHTAPTQWSASIFGNDGEGRSFPKSRPRMLLELRGSTDQGWRFVEHDNPTRTLGGLTFVLDNVVIGPQSTVLNPLDGSQWVFVRAVSLSGSESSKPEVLYRHVHSSQAALNSWVPLGSPISGSDSRRIIEIGAPIVVSRVDNGLLKINLFVFALVSSGPIGPGVPTEWELFERHYDGSQWLGWIPHGSPPRSMPSSVLIEAPEFQWATAVQWWPNGTSRIDLFGVVATPQPLFGIPAQHMIEFSCEGAQCGFGPLRDGPHRTTFSPNASFAYESPDGTHLSVVGITDGEIWEFSRTTSGNGVFRKLYPR